MSSTFVITQVMSKMINTDYKKGLRNAFLVGLEIPEFHSNCHNNILQNILHSHIQLFDIYAPI